MGILVRLGTVVGLWERDTGVRDNFGTHSQLAAMAVTAQTAVLPAREIQRDWVYSRDVANAIAALLHAATLNHTLYNVSSGQSSLRRKGNSWQSNLRASTNLHSLR